MLSIRYIVYLVSLNLEGLSLLNFRLVNIQINEIVTGERTKSSIIFRDITITNTNVYASQEWLRKPVFIECIFPNYPSLFKGCKLLNCVYENGNHINYLNTEGCIEEKIRFCECKNTVCEIDRCYVFNKYLPEYREMRLKLNPRNRYPPVLVSKKIHYELLSVVVKIKDLIISTNLLVILKCNRNYSLKETYRCRENVKDIIGQPQ